MNTTIRLRRDALETYRRLVGAERDDELAALMGVDRSTVSRTVTRGANLSLKFIDGCFQAFPKLKFSELFEVVPNNSLAAARMGLQAQEADEDTEPEAEAEAS